MARITEADVHAAAAALDAQGIKPTTSKIREKLGSGSFSTIGQYLGTYQGTSLEEPEEHPEELESLLPIIWDKCLKITRERFEIEQADNERQIIELQAETQTLKSIIEKQDEKIETLEEEKKQLEGAKDYKEILERNLIKAETERDTLKHELKELIKAVGNPGKKAEKLTDTTKKEATPKKERPKIKPYAKTADWTKEHKQQETGV